MPKEKTITVNQLHRMLGKLIDQGRGRLPVCVNKTSFHHRLEPDGCVILDVKSLYVQVVPILDGDGFTDTNKDGTEKMRSMAIISGEREEGN